MGKKKKDSEANLVKAYLAGKFELTYAIIIHDICTIFRLWHKQMHTNTHIENNNKIMTSCMFDHTKYTYVALVSNNIHN